MLNSYNLINLYLSAGAGSDEFRQGVRSLWLPALESFAPELILVSAGFDAHRDDPMAELCLVDDDYRWIGDAVKKGGYTGPIFVSQDLVEYDLVREAGKPARVIEKTALRDTWQTKK